MTHPPRILLFTGDGKGKTTAALGMAFRASGHQLQTCIVQFIKGDASVGEVMAAAASPHVRLIQTGLGFLPPRSHPSFEQHAAAAQSGLRQAAEIIASGQFQLVILDEICLAVARDLIAEPQVAELVAQSPPEVCLVLTGRGATPGLMALADTVTDMQCVKHGLQTGRPAQKGVEL